MKKTKFLINRDKIVIVDIEATCWEGHHAPPGEQSEIIEIGVCLLDMETFQPSDKRSILVKPERSKVSPFCTQLTTLTHEQVSMGIGFERACAILEQDYGAKDRAWASWGNFDRKMFETQCASCSVSYPFSVCYINAKKLYAKFHKRQQYGMTHALANAGLELEGTHHRGDDDAWNIARLMQYMLNRYGVGMLRKVW